MHVRFGLVADQVMSFARYLRRDDSTQRWTQVSAKDFEALSGRRGVPQHGVLEVLAQQMIVSWASSDDDECRQLVHVPPRAIQNSGASCLMAGVDAGVPQLSVSELNALVEHLAYLWFVELPDNATSCKRKLWATHKMLKEKVLHIFGGCAVHQLSRINMASDAHTLTPDIYHLKYVCHQVSYGKRLFSQLLKLVSEELVVLDSSQIDSSEFDSWKAFREYFLEHSLFRAAHITRGRVDERGESDEPADNEEPPLRAPSSVSVFSRTHHPC